jgi:hypothetical protein
MASFQALQQGEALKRTKAFVLTDITKMPCMQVQHVGPELFGKVEVKTTTGDIHIYADDADGTTEILQVNVSETIHNTFGKCKDAIEATGIFRCDLIGAKRSDASAVMMAVKGSTDCRTTNGLTLFFLAVTDAQIFGFAITNNKFTGRPSGGFATINNNRTTDVLVENAVNYLEILVSATDHGTTTIYACDDVNNVETALWSDAFVTATKETHGSSDAGDLLIKAPEGTRLVVQFLAATSTDDFSSPTIYCNGSTKHMIGLDVPGANYTGIA